jgi:hypothetical protein
VMHSVSLESPETSAYGWVPVLDPIRSREPWPEPIRFGWCAHVRAASDTWDDECTGLGFFSLFFFRFGGLAAASSPAWSTASRAGQEMQVTNHGRRTDEFRLVHNDYGDGVVC